MYKKEVDFKPYGVKIRRMDTQNFYQRIASQIKDIIIKQDKRLNKSKLARKLGVSPTYISKFMNKGDKIPAEKINQILDLYGYELGPVQKKTL